MRRAAVAVALLLALTACERHQEKPAKEAALKDNLFQMREAIDRFHAENRRYPQTLEELVPKYLRFVPNDPITGSATTWQVVREETVAPNADFTTATATESAPVSGGIIDVRSGAGAPYSSY